MMKTIGIEPVIASVIIVMIITGIGSGPFLSIVVITYGQRSNTNSSAVIESTAPKKILPVLLIHGYLSDAAIWQWTINGKIIITSEAYDKNNQGKK